MLACLDAPGDSEILRQFRWHLTTALDSLNTIKWRHYDQEVSQLSEVVECVLIAVSVTAGSMIGGTKDGNDKTKLQLYVSKIINGKQFEKAWSKPFFSASINITRAQRIITENYKPTKATVAREHTAKDETFAENKINNHLEEHLAMLKDLFDRKLIEDSEYKAARAKALEI